MRTSSSASFDVLNKFESTIPEVAAAASGETHRGFVVHPPSHELLNSTLTFLENLALSQRSTHSSQPLACLAHDVLNTSLTPDSMTEQPLLKELGYINLQIQLATLKITKGLCASLSQRTYAAVSKWEASHTARETSMSKTSQGLDADNIVSRCDIAMHSTEAILSSSDFQMMCFGGERVEDSNVAALSCKLHCTELLLRIRLLLRSEPFLVVCNGPIHMGALFQLARQAKLHLELLPTLDHINSLCK